jgi:hypothetical protein
MAPVPIVDQKQRTAGAAAACAKGGAAVPSEVRGPRSEVRGRGRRLAGRRSESEVEGLGVQPKNKF